ncbi:MAG: hypothetical protein NVS3B20_04730 [Polyangiales bacterium]
MNAIKTVGWAASAGIVFLLAIGAAACGGSVDGVGHTDGAASVGTGEAMAAVEYEHFPTRHNIDQGFERCWMNWDTARTREPLTLDEFFGRRIHPLKSMGLRVELIKSDPRESGRPLAFLRADYPIREGGQGDTDRTFNDRFNNVRVFRLMDSLGSTKSPFPEAVKIPTHVFFDTVLARMWTDFHPLSDGAPPRELHGSELLQEVARIGVWSFITSNLDGPQANPENAGFARFRDASGREFFRGVLVDSATSLNVSTDPHVLPRIARLTKPWNMNILKTGGIEAENIPRDVAENAMQIAGETIADLEKRLMFHEYPQSNASAVAEQVRANAREVVAHYRLH